MRMSRPYHWLARYYDTQFGLGRAPMDRARKQILRPILPRVQIACDLACGTGATAREFAARGIETFAIDLSPEMCRQIRAKARHAGLKIRVLQADMRSFCLPKPVDLITCEFDALNHIPRRSDLRLVAACAARALRRGGWFYFDVNNAPGFASYWTGTVCFEQPGVVLLMRNGHDLRRHRAWSDIDWFIRNGRFWKRHRERVEEVCWSEDEIRTALHREGFTSIQTWDSAPFFRQRAITPGCRTNYLACRS
jgi:SAM-dependent methyltransferase